MIEIDPAVLEAHASHRLSVITDTEESLGGLFCDSCGEYIIERDEPDTRPATSLEIDTDGTIYGSTLRINGELVPNCTGVRFEIVDVLANAVVYLDNVPVKFTGRMVGAMDDGLNAAGRRTG